MTALLPFFGLLCEGVTSTVPEIKQWLIAEVPDMRDLPTLPTLFYNTSEVALCITVRQDAPTMFQVWVSGSLTDRWWFKPERKTWIQLLVETLICVLERRGFQVQYTPGTVNWQIK